ncbi:hypothetical protein O3M35_003418 [Rhynocoris fuscipes]|uniref:Uncharacterized protein n=1 Tax=Rhynocoris fuscipes TaxID=488301 RepID=A0AAW1CMC9_9HEMI
MLLQIFENEYFIDAKSFDLGFSMIEIIQRVNIDLEKFNEWYKPGKFKEVFFDVYNFNLYATYRDAQCIYVWSLKNGKRINTIHIKNYLCKMRDMYLNNDKIYIIYAASKSVRHVSAYDINLEKWLYEVTTPLCKTQKILCSDTLLVGIAVAGPALTCTGVINVWQIENGKLVSEKHTQEYLSRTCVTTVYDVIIYTGTTSINIWEPRSNLLIRKITTVGNPVFLKSMPFIFVAVFTDKFAHIYDWYNGIRRFRLFTIFNPDSPEFIYADETMIILIDECNSVHMIGFC